MKRTSLIASRACYRTFPATSPTIHCMSSLHSRSVHIIGRGLIWRGHRHCPARSWSISARPSWSPTRGWRWEKPFGHDLRSAREGCQVLAEDQILRVDHFLGKEPVMELKYPAVCQSGVGRCLGRCLLLIRDATSGARTRDTGRCRGLPLARAPRHSSRCS